MSTPYVAATLFHNWIIPYGIPSFLWSNNRPQYVVKLFQKFFSTTRTNIYLLLRIIRSHMAKSSATARISSLHCISIYQTIGSTGTSMSNLWPMCTVRNCISRSRSLILAFPVKKPPPVSTVVPWSSLPSDASRGVQSWALRLHLLALIRAVKEHVDKSHLAA